jgi:NAD(P)-dependent dehydrogenase (short-subunit alcohol dehydrogenase family)
MAKKLTGRLALVTGASRGIGRAAALALAREGAHVIISSRTTGALEELDDEIRKVGGTATILALDLRKGDRIDQLGPTIFQRWGKLDILIGNAGILGPLSPLAHVTEDAWKMVLDINLTANWRLVRTLDPLLQRAEAGRAVFVTSGAASGKYAYWGPYAVAKAGLEALARTYANEVENTRVRVNLLNPGPVRTQMRAKAFPGEKPETLPAPEELGPLFVELSAASCTLNGEVVSFRDWQAGRTAPARG